MPWRSHMSSCLPRRKAERCGLRLWPVGTAHLATAYESAGDLGRAIPLHEATLAQSEQLLGDTHPNTLTCRNNLANARDDAEAVQHGSTATSATEAVPQEPYRAD
ncbi:tetratricopeptide repeat protein [Streptomyces scabiei]|uniref:tetratricopeptide repeat protein n=1 Tax=Streptomyces scabiei TaxID=1930 RepID=UPI003405C85A